jgi:hypothetical protein
MDSPFPLVVTGVACAARRGDVRRRGAARRSAVCGLDGRVGAMRAGASGRAATANECTVGTDSSSFLLSGADD